MKKAILLLSLLIAANTVYAGGSDIGNSGNKLMLLGMTYDLETVNIQVSASGCTHKDDFVIKRIETTPVSIEFVRVKHDICMMYSPQGTILSYTFAELGVKPGEDFQIVNKISRVIKGVTELF